MDPQELPNDIEEPPLSDHVGELFIDRGYIASNDVRAMAEVGRSVVCKPWAHQNGQRFSKRDFSIDLTKKVITCPNGKAKTFELGDTVSSGAEHGRR